MAGAPHKKGLDYFLHDTTMSSDQSMQLIEAEFGLKGYAIYLKLLEQIYADKGYYMPWDSDTKLLFAKRVVEDGALVGEVINGLLRRGLFNKSVYESSEVLTSKAIQERYLNAIKRRNTVEMNGEYLLIDKNEYDIEIIVYNNSNNVNNNTQSREEESRVEKSRHSARAGGKCELPGFEERRGKAICRQDVQQWMLDNNLQLSEDEFQYELNRFRDSFSGKRYKDWVATFRNYLRNRLLESTHWDYKFKNSSNGRSNKKAGTYRQSNGFAGYHGDERALQYNRNDLDLIDQ